MYKHFIIVYFCYCFAADAVLIKILNLICLSICLFIDFYYVVIKSANSFIVNFVFRISKVYCASDIVNFLDRYSLVQKLCDS